MYGFNGKANSKMMIFILLFLRREEYTTEKGDWKVVGKYFDSNTDSFLDTTTELHS